MTLKDIWRSFHWNIEFQQFLAGLRIMWSLAIAELLVCTDYGIMKLKNAILACLCICLCDDFDFSIYYDRYYFCWQYTDTFVITTYYRCFTWKNSFVKIYSVIGCTCQHSFSLLKSWNQVQLLRLLQPGTWFLERVMLQVTNQYNCILPQTEIKKSLIRYMA